MQSSRTHHRARSAGALSPASEPPSSRARPSHRSTASVPELPALQLPPEGLGFPGIPSSPTRIAAARNAPPLPPLNLPAQALHVPGVNNPHLDWDVPLFEDRREGHTTPRANEDQEQRQPPAGLMNRTLEVLGYIGQDARARRALLSFVFSMIWWFAQVCSQPVARGRDVWDVMLHLRLRWVPVLCPHHLGESRAVFGHVEYVVSA